MSRSYVDKVLWSVPGFSATGKKASLLFSSDKGRCTILRDPRMWWGSSIKEIFELRNELMWGILPPYDALPRKLEGNCLRILMSTSPSEVKCGFKKELRRISHSRRLLVGGSTGNLVDLRITDSYSPNHDIQRISARNVGASEGIIALYEAGIDICRIPELVSAGLLGTWQRRRMIPTKSATVIVDETVASDLLSEIIRCPSLECFEVYYSTYLDTTYV